jgi:hypothetical protein
VIGFNEGELRSFVQTLLTKGPYPRLLGSRFFQGTIQTVAVSGAGYLCKISRTNEATTDGVDYFCLTPNYVPHVGDLVQLVWLDANVAMILWPLNRPATQNGTTTLTVLNATKEITGSVVFPFPYPAAITPLVLVTIQNINTTVAGERPASVAAYQVTNLGFNLSVDTFINVAANRALTIGWMSIG